MLVEMNGTESDFYIVEHQQVNILFKVCLPLEINAYVYLGSGAAALAGAVLVSGQRAWSAALLLRSVCQHFYFVIAFKKRLVVGMPI